MPDEPKNETHPPSDGDTHREEAEATPAELTSNEPTAPSGEPPVGADYGADAASPAAIMKRVSALDDEDAGERLAREEEAKLEARRNRERQPKKKSAGLQAAASKRLAKIGTKAPVRRDIATAADADPLLDRATDFSEWAKKNQRLVGGVGAAIVLAVGATLGYIAYERKRETDASVQLAKAVAEEHGRIGDPDKDDDPDRPHDPTPIFKTSDERRDAALAAFRAVESKYHGTGAAILARLSEGSLLLDKEDPDGALAAYHEVSTSALAKADGEVRGRALEGMGFADELKADAETGDAQKALLDDAGKQYRTLENTEIEGFKELGIYHQARILQKQGNNPQAIDLLKKLHERLHAEGKDQHDFVYLDQVADDALRSLSPSALPPKPAGMGGRPGARGAGGKNQIDAAQLQKIYEQMQKAGKIPKGAPMPTPAAP